MGAIQITMQPVHIDKSEHFPHLNNAPIVEAVVDFRTHIQGSWEEKPVIEQVRLALPEYAKFQSQHRVSWDFQVPLQPHSSPAELTVPGTAKELGWDGVRAEKDQQNVVIFSHKGFSFSWLKPYSDWTTFINEAMRLWNIYKGLAESTDVIRLGLRFINRLDVSDENLIFDNYFSSLQAAPLGWPSIGFLYKDTFPIVGHPYQANVVRTFQPHPNVAKVGLMLDTDVICSDSSALLDDTQILDHLSNMRWIKNKVFFSSFTELAVEMCK